MNIKVDKRARRQQKKESIRKAAYFYAFHGNRRPRVNEFCFLRNYVYRMKYVKAKTQNDSTT